MNVAAVRERAVCYALGILLRVNVCISNTRLKHTLSDHNIFKP